MNTDKLLKGLIAAGMTLMLGILVVGCNSDSVTAPDPIVPERDTVVTNQGTVPTPEPQPTPEPENQKGDNRGPVSVRMNQADGSGVITNGAKHTATKVRVVYTPVQHTEIYHRILVPGIEPGGTFVIPPAVEVLSALFPDPGCEPWEWSKFVQIDVKNNSEHIGAVPSLQVTLYQLALPVIPIGEPTSNTVWDEGSDLIEGDEGCYEERYGKTTITQPYQCADDKLTFEKAYETRPVECPVICKDTLVWTLTNVSRRTHTYAITTARVWNPWDYVEFSVTLKRGDTYEFQGYEGQLLYVYEHDEWYEWKYEHEFQGGFCPVVEVGDFGALCTGKLKTRCECIFE